MTNSEKLKIVRSIGSEDELRTDVLIPIFTEMGYETVDEVHGANEKGKDIVLVEKDKFGDYVYTAVIVKNKDVSNATSGTSKELVGNLSTQIAMTVASGYDCRLQSKHVDFNRISVITGGRISQTAMDTLIKVALQNRFTNIVFKDGEDVVQLIDRYLPDYYFFSSGILASYTDALRTRCNHLDELRNISAYKGEIKKLVDVFVSPTLYRVNRQEKKERRQSRPEFNKLENLLFLRNHLIVVSGPGGGKSTLVRAQVQRLLSLNARGKQLFLPVLIRAVDMVSFTSTQLEAILNDYIRSTYKLPAFDLIKLMELESCTAFIFIDGLDEIASADDRQRIHEVINEFAQRSLRHKLVLTTRDCSYSSETSFAKTQQWYLLPFRAKEVERFIARWFSSKEPNHKLMKALEEHNLLSKLPSTPLALTLLAILFDSDTHTEVPANLSELYQMFVDLLLGKWNLDRRIQSFYDSNIKEYVLMEVAEYLHEKGRYALSTEEFRQIAHICRITLMTEVDSDGLLEELLNQTGLLVKNDKGDLEFRHLSFQEFLVGRKYQQRGKQTVEATLSDRFDDPWWIPVAYYYCGLKKESTELLLSILDKMKDYPMAPAIRSAWEYGYLIQSSYLTPAQVRIDCIVTQLRQYAERVRMLLEELPRRGDAQKITPAHVLVSMIEMCRIHYGSSYLTPVYREVLARLADGCNTFEERFSLLVVATILAEEDKPDYLMDIYDEIRKEPILLLALDFELNLRLEMSSIPESQKGRVNSVIRKIRRSINRGRGLYDVFFKEAGKVPLEVAATSEDTDETNNGC